MWMLLSARLRAWLLLVIALPAARLAVRRLAAVAERRDPAAVSTRLIRGADSALAVTSRRAARRRRR